MFINGKGPSIAAVDGGGQFAADLTLYYGENRLEFNLYGLVEGEQAGIPHNLTTPFILTAEFAGLPIYAIDITLHIDPRLDLASANSINLYVIDPTGDCCWDGDRTTDDGGRLYSSFDTTHNPTCYYQRFWLGYDDTVRWGEGYKVRAQWREDMQYSGSHIEPPAYYEVLIALCAGYETEEITYLSGEIEGPHDWWNNECDATGPDWVDIAVVSPTQP